MGLRESSAGPGRYPITMEHSKYLKYCKGEKKLYKVS